MSDIYERVERNVIHPSILATVQELLCASENMLPVIEKHLHKFGTSGWEELCSHAWAFPLLQRHIDMIPGCGWSVLGKNVVWALPLLRSNMDAMNPYWIGGYEWVRICKHEWALPWLQHNINYIREDGWDELCNHEWALPLLLKNASTYKWWVDKITERGWNTLCQHEWALPLLMDNISNSNSFNPIWRLTATRIGNYGWELLRKHEWAKPLIEAEKKY
jgi:hypothetical protein